MKSTSRMTVHTLRSALHELLEPKRLLSCREILARPCPIPKVPGIYAWYFRQIPGVPTAGRHTVQGLKLLYIGISPCRPSLLDRRRVQSIRRRIRYHARGNAEGSTLRLSLGCLLSRPLRVALRRVGSGKRMTFGPGEKRLTKWMLDNAFVAWSSLPAPWNIEHSVIARLTLPLNIRRNTHPFSARLSALRSRAKARARRLPISYR